MNYKTLVILIVCIAAVIVAGCTSLQGSTAKSTIAPAPAGSGRSLRLFRPDTHGEGSGADRGPHPGRNAGTGR